MKVTQDYPNTFKPVTITLETRYDLNLLVNAIDTAIEYGTWNEENEFKLRHLYKDLETLYNNT